MVAKDDGNERDTKVHNHQCETLESILHLSSSQNRTEKHTVTSPLSPAPSRNAKKVSQERTLRPRKRDNKQEADQVTAKKRHPAANPRSKAYRVKSERRRIVASSSNPASQQQDSEAAQRPGNQNPDIARLSKPPTSSITRTRTERVSKKPNNFGYG